MPGQSPPLVISPEKPEPEKIADAARIIRSGGVVVFPTSGLYGLGTDAMNPHAVTRIFRIKNRTAHKPVSVLVRDLESLEAIVRRIPPAASALMERFWPGGLTLVFAASDELPESLTAGSGKVGVRLPLHPVASALVRALSWPMTATSANVSGAAGCSDIQSLAPEIARSVDLVLDAGPVAGGAGSTVVDVTMEPPTVLREGTVPAADILACLGVD